MSILDLNQLIAEVLVLLRRDLVSNSVSLRTELAGDLPSVIGDRIRLQQVFVNLVMNAVEATNARGEGPRVIVISSQSQSPDQIVIAVRDSGVGIATETTEELFQPFFSNKDDGMGMGLWISRSIVEAHGGTLWATRNEDAGATFQFTIPAVR
jgi:signal transduction histidine kinase